MLPRQKPTWGQVDQEINDEFQMLENKLVGFCVFEGQITTKISVCFFRFSKLSMRLLWSKNCGYYLGETRRGLNQNNFKFEELSS